MNLSSNSLLSSNLRAVTCLTAFLVLTSWSASAAESDAAPAPLGFWERDTLTGDWGGTRTSLGDAGVALGATYTGDLLGAVSGGFRQGTVYMGRLELDLDLDLDKMAGWQGGTIHVSAYQIHGRGLTEGYLGNLAPTSNIEADRSTRLFTAWIQQSLFDDRLSVRAGQLAADDEFIISPTAATFMNATFGWTPFVAANLPAGGPAYPLATPGVRFKAQPIDNLSLLVGIFSGNPAGSPGTTDPQVYNGSGTTFSLTGGTFVISELQYGVNQGKDASGLPGIYKVGGWYHSGTFANLDQRYTNLYSGDHGLYAVADQMIWKEPGTDDQGLNVFLRLGATPGDRNLISFYADGGLAYKGLVPGRTQDTVALGVAYAKVGDHAREFDQASGFAVRSGEKTLELTYVAQVTPWWTLQPDFQYIFTPGAGQNSANPTKNIPDAAVLGLRTTVKF